MFSPDGRWIAYESSESGERQIYVKSAAAPHGKWQVSFAGGARPVWAPDGDEPFHLGGHKMMVVRTGTGSELRIGAPIVLFETEYRKNYDVAPDGNRFLMIQADTGARRHNRIILNWYEELKVEVPPG